MAFAATSIWEIQTGGDDTNNGGGFDPAVASKLADLAVVSGGTGATPVVSSASYNFLARDVGHWLFIASGTNWTPGWYLITAVSSNQATLDAAVGHVPQYNSTYRGVLGLNTATGVGSATTGGTFTIDYSQSTGISLTGIGGTTTTINAVTGIVFGKNFLGNVIQILTLTGGTAPQRLQITAAVASTSFTVDKTIGGSGLSGGTGVLGGPLATPGQAGALRLASNQYFLKSGTYNLSGSTANAAGGPVSDDTTGGSTTPSRWEGYGTYRGDKGTRPVIAANAQTSVTVFAFSGAHKTADNIIADGSSGSTNVGFSCSASRSAFIRCKAQNCTTATTGIGFSITATMALIACEATNCNGTAAFSIATSNGAILLGCEAYANTTIGFRTSTAITFVDCLSYGNTGASSDGFSFNSQGCYAAQCVAYSNGRYGFDLGNVGQVVCHNCIAEGNTNIGFYSAGNVPGATLLNCAGYNNNSSTTAANTFATTIPDQQNCVLNTTGSFFTNAGSNDFSLNPTASQGRLARATGYPGLYPRGTTTGYVDIGAVQHRDVFGAATLSGGLA